MNKGECSMSIKNDVVRFIEPEVKEYGAVYYWTFLVTDNELVIYRSSVTAETFGGYWGMLICSAIRRSRASKKIGKTPSEIIPRARWKFVFPRNEDPIQLRTKRKGMGKSFSVLLLSDQYGHVDIDVTDENIMERIKKHCPEIEMLST